MWEDYHIYAVFKEEYFYIDRDVFLFGDQESGEKRKNPNQILPSDKVPIDSSSILALNQLSPFFNKIISIKIW